LIDISGRNPADEHGRVDGLGKDGDEMITMHVHAAKTQGATKEEIAEALGVAVAVNAGAAPVYSARVIDAIASGE
jgi:alkylhydroperoxidase/carboxymuconolactone decarboxylase family protein YurZ